MKDSPAFLDTSFVWALLDRRDQFHDRAKALQRRLFSSRKVWITEAIFLEIGNAFSDSARDVAVGFIERCYHTENIQVVALDGPLLARALQLYQSHRDKAWGLTDCVSFIVMRENGLTDAFTADRHFTQAGFVALLLEES